MDINLTQVIHNVKEAYVDLTGDTDDITYGNISTKISEIQTGGGIAGGYTVTFKVDGNDYYVASCQQGESITEPPTPTMQGATFGAWQLNGVNIEFPYTPSADVELTAVSSSIYEVTGAGAPLYTYSGGAITKTTADVAIYGYCTYNTTQKFMFLISKVANDTGMSGNINQYGNKKNFTYNGETWYFSHSNASEITSIDHAAINVGDYNQYGAGNIIAAAILDAYFGA